MTQLHTPKASRNQDTGRLSFMVPSMGGSADTSTRGSAVNTSALLSPSSATPGTFSSVPTPSCTSTHVRDHTRKSVRRTPARRAAVPLATAAALLLCGPLTVAPAYAADQPGGSTDEVKPPAHMSTVGGKRLGRPGIQVDLKQGAPALPKGLSGKSWLVADAESGDVLASYNAHWQLPPASTLKMLFADTVLPKLPKTKTHKVELSDLEGMGEGSSLVGVKENYTYTVHDLWLGVFLRSGNDAVHVLSAMNGGVPATVRDMQAHAKYLNARDTHVVTPDGYDEKGQVSSAYDLTLFARSGLQKADFREYCSTATAQFPGTYTKDKKGEKSRSSFGIQNTNRLLTGYGVEPYKGIAGVKNGYTSHAGSTFTGVAQRGDRVLLVTVMNPQKAEANEVYKESAKLLDWGFEASGSVNPVGTLVRPGTAGASHPSADGKDSHKDTQASVSADNGSSNGLWTAAGIAGGSLALLGAAAFGVHRRWPLPELVRRRSRD
ncbi:D-alanyl-D-alanine carboxypeptidase [Streptomyces sp. NPDC044780]|uniref:D-alanyl-D-alanine carboxypeptidase n=1 Tax=unclassified Streptomyces TaxID=2593676 RepID=UPI0033CC4392